MHQWRRQVLFHQDNAWGYDLLFHPPYSPDLAPGDLFLFLNWKKYFSEKWFGCNNEIIVNTNAYLEDLETYYNFEGSKKGETLEEVYGGILWVRKPFSSQKIMFFSTNHTFVPPYYIYCFWLMLPVYYEYTTFRFSINTVWNQFFFIFRC